MPELETGTPGYRADVGQAGGTTVDFREGQRILGILASANAADGSFLIASAQGTTMVGDIITVRSGRAIEWNPQARLINPTIIFSSSIDWVVEFIVA